MMGGFWDRFSEYRKVRIPAAGGKSWYQEDLYRCETCGATVHADDRAVHHRWHEAYQPSPDSEPRG